MKKFYSTLIATLFVFTVFAQIPEKMTYQAVIRDGANALVQAQSVGVQISILKGSVSGTVVFSETHTTSTNVNGLVSVEIGGGTVVSGDFSTIDWSTGPYYIKTETDIEGGTNYTITGTSQLLSVPYALYAKTAENVTGGIAETDPVYNNSQAALLTNSDIENLSKLSGTNTGDQDITGIEENTQALKDTAAQIRADIPDVSGLLSDETDPVFGSSQAAKIKSSDISNLKNLSGINTGDQDISGIEINEKAIQDTAVQIRAAIPDVSGFLSLETDPVFLLSEAANIDSSDISILDNLSGINTGDQDISGIEINEKAIQDTAAQIRADIPDVSGIVTNAQAIIDTATRIRGEMPDISGIAINTEAIIDTAFRIRADIPDVSDFLTYETDSVFMESPAAYIDSMDVENIKQLSGKNTGDQDLSGITANTMAIQDTALQIRAEIYEVNKLASKFTESPASEITKTDLFRLDNLSGTNTGDQDIRGIAINKKAIQDTAAQIRSDIPDVSGIAINAKAIKDTAASLRAQIPDVSAIAKNTKTIQDLTAKISSNTADISGIERNKQAIQDTAAQIRSDIPDVSDLLNSAAANITAEHIVKLNNLSGVNTGDQDLSALAEKTTLIDSIMQLRNEMKELALALVGNGNANVNLEDLLKGLLESESDPVFRASEANKITSANITNLNNLSGSNTGDQDISGILVNAQSIKDTALQIRADIPDVSTFISKESDPEYVASVAASITKADTANWNNKLDRNSETDPVFSSWDKSSGITISKSQISDLGSSSSVSGEGIFNSLEVKGEGELKGKHVASFENENGGDGDGIIIKLGKKKLEPIFTDEVISNLIPVSDEMTTRLKKIFEGGFEMEDAAYIMTEGAEKKLKMMGGAAVTMGNLIVNSINEKLDLPNNIVPKTKIFNKRVFDPSFTFSYKFYQVIPDLHFGFNIKKCVDVGPYDACLRYKKNWDIVLPNINRTLKKDFTLPSLTIPSIYIGPYTIPKISEIDLSDYGIDALTLNDIPIWGLVEQIKNAENQTGILDKHNEFITFTDVNDSKLGAVRAESFDDWKDKYLLNPLYLYGLLSSFRSVDGFYHFSEKIKIAVENLSNIGVEYSSGNGDYAEWLERINPNEVIVGGDIVAVIGGRITKNLEGAEQVMAVSHNPIVLGNIPTEGKSHLGNNIAFMGQIPVKVIGVVKTGDYIVGNGKIPGYGEAIDPTEMRMEDFKYVVGRSWEDNPVDGPKMVNTVVGIHNGDYLNVLKRYEQRIKKSEERIESVEAKVDRLTNVLLKNHELN